MWLLIQQIFPFLNTTHMGFNSFENEVSHKKNLLLQNILCVPQIVKYLLSVFKFAQDNCVFFKFHSLSSYMKDLSKKEVLLKCKVDWGLHRFNLNLHKPQTVTSSFCHSICDSISLHINKTNFVRQCTDISLWHCHLGHASFLVVKKVLDKNCIPYSNDSINMKIVCVSYQMGKSHTFPFSLS